MLREIGVTRLSMGVQTMDDELLHKNGRSHSSEWVYKAVGWARQNAFPVINLDLMSGVIDETPETWDRQPAGVHRAGHRAHLDLPHGDLQEHAPVRRGLHRPRASAASPPMRKRKRCGSRRSTSSKALAIRQTTGHSFVRAANMGFDHVQRTDIWGGAGELLGMGVSSYSYLDNTVFQNTSDWGTYVGKVMAGETPVGRGLRLNSRQQMAREVVLGLKTLRFDRPAFQKRHGFDVLDLYAPQVENLVKDGLIEVSDDALTITRKARAYVDIVCSVFYLAEHNSYKFHRFATEQELTRATINVDELMKHGVSPRFDSELAVLGYDAAPVEATLSYAPAVEELATVGASQPASATPASLDATLGAGPLRSLYWFIRCLQPRLLVFDLLVRMIPDYFAYELPPSSTNWPVADSGRKWRSMVGSTCTARPGTRPRTCR